MGLHESCIRTGTTYGGKGETRMENASACLELGVILCKHCQTTLGTLDTEKVTTFYSDCLEQECLETRKDEISNEG
ncbi:GapA-binding peptide SR1P [Paenibacillus sp. GCM10027628]|uniref:GapA-binding peptide SR1P n=1 Tax=Paenibacillus sp. GCM10027628 TaxID=3273413 RepID=UPI0036292EBF